MAITKNKYKIFGKTTKIFLNGGRLCLIDTEDLKNVLHFHWCARHGKCTSMTYSNNNSKEILIHRLIMKPGPEFVVDHINHDQLDNRKKNLRICTDSQNSMNTRKLRLGATSIYKGVYYRANRKAWISRILANNNRKYLGYFNTEIEAAKAYDEAAKKYYGEFANLNFKENKPC